MSRISEERKEILLRRYGNIILLPVPEQWSRAEEMSGGFGGPAGKTAWIWWSKRYARCCGRCQTEKCIGYN